MKGAIFDVDGTLLDSMGAWYDAALSFFSEHGIDIPKTELIKYQSMRLEDSLPVIQKEFLPDMSMDEMIGSLKDTVRRAYAETLPEKTGACEYIKKLHRDGVKIAVATSGYAELCQSSFKRLGIFDMIHAYAFSNEVGCGKENPDIYLLAAKRLGLEPSECTVYEDLIDGIESAASVGFKTVAVADASNTELKDRLIQCSDCYITGWNELLSK